jgi:hypothetical protein
MGATDGILALFALVVVAVIAYRAGYLWGQAELVRHGQPTEAEWDALRMTSVLPRWRRVAGWAAYAFSGLLFSLFLFLAFQYAKGWGWALLLAVWGLWFAIFLGVIGLAEWCWKPPSSRESQERRQQEGF